MRTAETAYPTPCTADMPFDVASAGGDTVASATLIVPDECGLITVIVTNLDLLGMVIPVEVSATPMPVGDQFERTRVAGWGRADSDWRWRDPDGGPVDGSVSHGAGQLNTNGLLSRAETDAVPPVTVEVLLISRFSSCT